MKSKFRALIIIVIILTGCSTNNWQVNDMLLMSDASSTTINDGGIPKAMQNWQIIADVSKYWFPCNYDFILRYTKISIDQEGRIWIFGPDLSNGPVGGITDNPGCDGDNSPRLLVFDQKSNETETGILTIGDDEILSTASGWIDLSDNRILVNSVFIYKQAWDSAEGGKGNKYIDLAVIENGTLRELFNESNSEFSVPDLLVSGDMVYLILTSVKETYPQLFVFDLNTEKLVRKEEIGVCQSPRSIELIGDDIFILCQEGQSNYSLFISSGDFSNISLLSSNLTFVPDLANNGNGFQLSADKKGRVWIGFSYVVELMDGKWILSTIFPDKHMVGDNNRFVPKPIYGVVQYKDGLLFSLDGGLFYADYENHKWKSIIHNGPPFPIVVDNDGRVYAFTGKYILAIP